MWGRESGDITVNPIGGYEPSYAGFERRSGIVGQLILIGLAVLGVRFGRDDLFSQRLVWWIVLTATTCRFVVEARRILADRLDGN